MNMLPLALVLAGVLQDPAGQVSAPPAQAQPGQELAKLQGPAKEGLKNQAPEAPKEELKSEVKPGAAPADPSREVVTARGERRPRVDLKKPYIRVWFWPPTPPEPEAAAGSGQAQARGGRPQMEDIRFATSSARVLDEEAAQERLARWLKENRDRRVILDGFADARGGKKFNQRLAHSRAEAVKQNLVSLGAAENQITIKGHGSTSPIKGHTPHETWWLSRRVTVTILEPAAAVAKEEHGNPE